MFIKKLAGLTLAGLMAVSAVSVPVNAAAQARDAECPSHQMIKVNEEISYCDPAPTYHRVIVDYTYECRKCGHKETYSNVYQEEHDYLFDSVTFEHYCWKCGDTYK